MFIALIVPLSASIDLKRKCRIGCKRWRTVQLGMLLRRVGKAPCCSVFSCLPLHNIAPELRADLGIVKPDSHTKRPGDSYLRQRCLLNKFGAAGPSHLPWASNYKLVCSFHSQFRLLESSQPTFSRNRCITLVTVVAATSFPKLMDPIVPSG